MSFSFTPQQTAIKNQFAEFAHAELNQHLQQRDRSDEFAFDAWKKCAEFGVQGLHMPKEYGGQEADILTAVAAMEGLGYGCRDNGLMLALNAQMWTVQLSILSFATEDQKEQYLRPLCDGRWIAAYAITEPDSGSDAYSLSTRAEKRGDVYVLNGRKTMITLAPIADLLLVFANTDPSKGKWGVTAFLVAADTPGLNIVPQEKMGLRTVPMGEFVMEDCAVPESARLGSEGAGIALSAHSLEWERSCMLASQLGAMEFQIEKTIAFAKSRQQFGQPIAGFQAVSHRIAEMKLRLEAARLLIYKVAWLKSEGKPATLDAALAKLALGEAYVQCSLDAIRIHGGRGYLVETGVEQELRDSVGTVLYGGTSDIQREIVARLLGL